MKKIALFASGSGTNAENFMHYFKAHDGITVDCVLSNKADAYVHERARKCGVPSYTFSKQQFNDGTVLAFLRQHKIDFIVLAGYMLMVSNEIMAAYPKAIVNIHPSLLPKYGGKGMHGDLVHQAVVAAGEKETGITIHYINDVYDSGEIVCQKKCAVLPNDTPQQVAEKVHALEYEWFPKVVESLLLA